MRWEILGIRAAGPRGTGVRTWLSILAWLSLPILAGGCVFETARQGPAILFMGNSITRNVPAPAFGWSGNWGMAATSMENDYVHQTVRLLKERGLELELNVAEHNCPDCDGTIDEQARNMELVRRLHPRYVVVQLSEHSFDIELRSGKMTEQYRRLLQGLRDAGVPHVYCLGSWGETDIEQPHNVGIYLAVRDFPEYEFVDIGPVAADSLNYGDKTLFADPAVQWHPGDRGMLGIARALADAIAREE